MMRRTDIAYIKEGVTGAHLLSDYLRTYIPVLVDQNTEGLLGLSSRLLADAANNTQVEEFDQEGNMVGVGSLRPLSFDSELYEMKMGRVDFVVSKDSDQMTAQIILERIIKEAKEIGIEHLHLRVPARYYGLVHAAQALGFCFVSGNAHFLRPVLPASLEDSAGGVTVEKGTHRHTQELRAIASEAFREHTRFHVDPYLSSDRATYLHEVWTENCLKGDVADVVLVAKSGGRMAGFVTVQTERDFRESLGLQVADIGLFAVAADFRRQGVGRRLLAAALQWCKDQGVELATVGTELGNVAAIGSYIASGFRISHSTYSFSWVPSAG